MALLSRCFHTFCFTLVSQFHGSVVSCFVQWAPKSNTLGPFIPNVSRFIISPSLLYVAVLVRSPASFHQPPWFWIVRKSRRAYEAIQCHECGSVSLGFSFIPRVLPRPSRLRHRYRSRKVSFGRIAAPGLSSSYARMDRHSACVLCGSLPAEQSLREASPALLSVPTKRPRSFGEDAFFSFFWSWFGSSPLYANSTTFCLVQGARSCVNCCSAYPAGGTPDAQTRSYIRDR